MRIDGDSAWAYDGGQEPCETGKEFLDSQSQDIIKLVLALFQKSISVHPTKKCFTFKNTMRYGSKPTLSYKPQLSIQMFLLIRTPWLLKSLPIIAIYIDVNHGSVGFSSATRKRKKVGEKEINRSREEVVAG